MNIKELEETNGYKEGIGLQNIPLNLKNLLPNTKLLLPKQKPGVYGFYFPSINKIYVGQSKSVSFEISMYRTGQRTQILLNKLINENKNTLISFVFYQGDALADSTLRRSIETFLIKETAGFNVNLMQTPKAALIEPSNLAETDFLKTEIIDGSLAKYGLNYNGIKPTGKQSSIYVFINPKTKNFYVGETSDFIGARVMKRHRTSIYAYFKRKANDMTLASDKTLAKICDDLSEKNNTLLFTVIKELNGADKKTRVAEESAFKRECEVNYKGRLYNAQNVTPTPAKFSQTAESKDRIRQAAAKQDITQDLTSYPCICHGKWYSSLAEASRAYGYKTSDGLKKKLLNPNEKDYIWLKNTLDKPLPNDLLLQQKIADFFRNLKIKPVRVIKRGSWLQGSQD